MASHSSGHVEAQGPSVQAIALAATKSGCNSADLQQLAALGNYGRSSEHIASQVISKYCQSDSINLPEPFFAEVPVSVRTADDWVVSVKPVALYLPHEWFAWLEMEEQAAGFGQLEEFWDSHSMDDPKLDGNPVMDASWLVVQKQFTKTFGKLCVLLGAQYFMWPRKAVANSFPSFCMVMVVPFRDQIPVWFSACAPCYLHPMRPTAKCYFWPSQSQQYTSLRMLLKTPCTAFGQS